jgi:hypothetical protein
VLEQALLAPQAAREAAERAIGIDHAVAGNDQRTSR